MAVVSLKAFVVRASIGSSPSSPGRSLWVALATRGAPVAVAAAGEPGLPRDVL